jgi:hypothetical protein
MRINVAQSVLLFTGMPPVAGQRPGFLAYSSMAASIAPPKPAGKRFSYVRE